jgi:hypothetical protein
MTTALAALLVAAAPAWAQSTATLKGVDVYRSDSIASEDIHRKTDHLVSAYVRMRNDTRKSAVKAADKLKNQIEAAVRSLGETAYVAVSYNEYVTAAEHTAYVTLDVVDAKDAAARMPFRAAPSGKVADSAGLVAAWQRYAGLGQNLTASGHISTERPECPAFYCSWGSATPELAALEKRFASEAKANKDILKAIAREESSPVARAAALYVFSYAQDGKELAALCAEALTDPSAEVRSASLQILSDLSLYHKDVFLDVRAIIPALDYPTVSDRAKAMAALIGIADNETYKPYVLSRGTPYLVRLLRLSQPSNHDLAFTLLGVLSKESFDRRDYESWDRWAESVSHTE